MSADWTVEEPPVLQAGLAGSFDEVAVKDPSIVRHGGLYHLFYTGKYSEETAARFREAGRDTPPMRVATGYVAAPSLEELAEAPRWDLSALLGENVVAPQVFRFEPHGLWYLVGHRVVPGTRELVPVYLTNEEIGAPGGWSEPRDLRRERPGGGFWIDFWVICDEDSAHLFYTDHSGAVFRMECPLDAFPEGFAAAEEEVALEARGEDAFGRWSVFEASHVYRAREPGGYFMLVECAYWDEERQRYFDAEHRFLVGFVADSLCGPWRRAEADADRHFAHASGLRHADGSPFRATQVSHPELIRADADQRLEVEGYDFQMIFQHYDAASLPPGTRYDDLPWEISLARSRR